MKKTKEEKFEFLLDWMANNQKELKEMGIDIEIGLSKETILEIKRKEAARDWVIKRAFEKQAEILKQIEEAESKR